MKEQWSNVQRAKIAPNFISPDVGPVRRDGYNVTVESGETFRCATQREARELIDQHGLVEVSDFDALGASKRYFIGSMAIGPRAASQPVTRRL